MRSRPNPSARVGALLLTLMVVAASARAQTPPTDPPVPAGGAAQGTKAPDAKTPAKGKDKAKDKAKEKKDADTAKKAAEGSGDADAPGNTVPPEMEKIAKLAASAKFKEYVALAAERQKLFVRRSKLRMEMRGVEPTQSQRDEVESLNGAIGKVGDKMDSFVGGKTWTTDEYAAMDWIVSEAMRLYPIE